VVTGVPENDWQIDLPEGVCIDMVPVDEKGYVARPYGIDDMFKADELMDWASFRGYMPNGRSFGKRTTRCWSETTGRVFFISWT
jgi:hypothetical protein